MITYKELLSGHSIADVPINFQQNGETLLKRINIVRQAYGKPCIVSSGYRSDADHRRIYSQINAKRAAKGLPMVSIPWGSQHLTFSAVDIADPKGDLMQWCRDNVAILEKAELWVEDDPSIPRVHFQIFPPKSGNRFFKP
jgi:hypothetical protein